MRIQHYQITMRLIARQLNYPTASLQYEVFQKQDQPLKQQTTAEYYSDEAEQVYRYSQQDFRKGRRGD